MQAGTAVSSLVDVMRGKLRDAGLGEAELISKTPVEEAFGDTAAVFRIGPVRLRFTRERGQEFVDLAAESEPEKFHQFDDVDIAMGWRSVDEVLARCEPEPIDAVLRRVKANVTTLCDAFSGHQERLTRARVDRAARDRGEAFISRLRGKK
ncbi:MAG: hypothetical protein EPO25_09100 [Gammaproteobacteria bacterium]|jgi:hypothetical protein|nr:MAG: hypothetical protein EPO25_09100 [Gammaproteobacteria bacterium]